MSVNSANNTFHLYTKGYTMKPKKILSLILISALCLSCTACNKNSDTKKSDKSSSVSESSEESKDDSSDNSSENNDSSSDKKDKIEKVDINDYFNNTSPNPALWKVTDNDSDNVLYMMGTIHVAGDNTFPLPDYVMDVYNGCEGIAVEYNVKALQSDLKELMAFQSAFVYTDGTDITNHISAEAYEIAKNYLKDAGLYNKLFNSYNAAYWMSLITNAQIMNIDNLSTDGVDMHFINLADKDKKQIVNIEKLDAQIKALGSYSDELVEYMIMELGEEDSTTITKDSAEELATLYNYWADGDIDKLAEESDIDEDSSIPQELIDDYNKSEELILTSRNKVMAERASQFIENGDNLFFMVGALHFAGDEGVDDLLEDMGYTVERID